MKAESFDKLYLPEPPTPTKSAFPVGKSKILIILQMCSMASLKRTKFITDFVSLCSVSFSSKHCFNYSMSSIGT